MRWIKKGLIYGPAGESWWAQKWALQPTPLLRDDGTIRIFTGFRTLEGVSRVGFVDVSADNPSQVLNVSKAPVFDIGVPGTFDENGVVPCAVVERDGELYMYYSGYQLAQKVKFYAFTGLAISADGGNSFQRYSQVPICDRQDGELFFRCFQSIMFENGVWRTWYVAGSKYTQHNGAQLPNYDIRYAEAPGGVTLNREYQICVAAQGDEYRLGKPCVIKTGDLYRMFYSCGTAAKGYRLGYAESDDGLKWVRKDDEVGIDASESGWDSTMQAYPSVIRYKDRYYMFYNGNNYGELGFGYAELDHW
jgi:predicted GH43/DUF377 family glycosyl hydrolase